MRGAEFLPFCMRRMHFLHNKQEAYVDTCSTTPLALNGVCCVSVAPLIPRSQTSLHTWPPFDVKCGKEACFSTVGYEVSVIYQ